MSNAQKSTNVSYHPFCKFSGQSQDISITVQQVERGHANRLRRMAFVLTGAAALLIINGIFVSRLV